MSDIEIEIDGQVLPAQPNQMLIEVADKAGIYIPRFCYHKHLSIAANCRMCLVEVEKSPKALPACATPVMPGMKVFTKSPAAVAAQRAVMEFLLINHPLDCPICDQGGVCELQDLTMGYGTPESYYDEPKRAVGELELGPLVATEMTRCIQCTRCVRFGEEIAGVRELGVTSRGGDEKISTFIKHSMTSEVSGNIIDICPVGALTAKPSRFKGRSWEMHQAPTIAPHDCVGTNINAHTLNGSMLRVVARENPAINETWIADRERFSYQALTHKDRLTKPLVRVNGKLQEVEWQKAFEVVAKNFQNILSDEGVDQLGALLSPSSTLEECYLAQKLVRAMGSSNIDHRLRVKDTKDQAQFPSHVGSALPLSDIQTCDAVLLIGSNIQKEQPIAALQLRKAVANGAVVASVNSKDCDFNFDVSKKAIVAPHEMAKTLSAIASGADKGKAIAELLKGKKKVAIILGAQAMHANNASEIRYFAQEIAKKSNGYLIMMTDGANGAGAWLAGAVPHRAPGAVSVDKPGMSAAEMLVDPRKALLLINVEPDCDTSNASLARVALEKASFVVALSVFKNKELEQHADVILPVAPYTETSGTFVNVSGDWQSFKGVSKNYAEARPAWKVLRVMANFLQLEGFDYESSEDISNHVKSLVEKMQKVRPLFEQPKPQAAVELTRVGEYPIYSVDALVRRSPALQEAQEIIQGLQAVVRMNSKMASKLGLASGERADVVQESGGKVTLPVMIDECIADHAVAVAAGIEESSALGDLYGAIDVKKSEK